MTDTQPKTYHSKPRTIKAVYLEKGGTYRVFGTLIEVKADTYAYMQDGHLMTVAGGLFRANWESDCGDQLVEESKKGTSKVSV